MPPLQLLIKPASGNCNLRCQYCFYADVSAHRNVHSFGLMSHETLEALVRRTFAYAEGSVGIAFQGGEPMLAGIDFYRDYLSLVKKYNTAGLPMSHAIQTNGVLIDEEWAALFKEAGFLVGISLDGTRANHDLYRKDARLEGTFGKVWGCIQLLQEKGVDFNILTVVTADTVRRIRPIYDFYKKHGLIWQQFIPCLNPLDEMDTVHPYTLTPELYGEFLCQLFDLWYSDLRRGQIIHNRYFENLVAMLRGERPEMCGLTGVCTPQLVIEADGSVYPCDFYVLDEYRMGNLHEQDLAEIDQLRVDCEFLHESFAVAEKCKSCQWYPICRGGCRRHREHEDRADQLNIFCKSYERFFAHALPGLQRLARM